MRASRAKPTRSLRLKPADPFELIRWLARSQSDPRKAVAELVQNSIDAGAKVITIQRVRHRGAVALVVRDDGEGVLPDLPREDALTYIATHVGRSRKLGIDPAERAKRVIAGQYGVGLLGFWAIGGTLEIRSRVAGSPLTALRLVEDSPEASILNLPFRTDDPETFTEVAVAPVHAAAQKALVGRRLADFLAAELRGQILRTGVSIVIHDRIARGTAQKRFDVAPVRFSGERLTLPAELEVPGHPPLHVELYLARGSERPAIQVAAAGSLVADDIAELDPLGLAEEPWVGRELVGLIDFAGLHVPPGTRRGVVPDAAATVFVDAMGRLRPLVEGELSRLDSERREALDRDVVRELKRALRGFRRRLPRYDLPRVQEGVVAESGEGAGDRAAEGEVSGEPLEEGSSTKVPGEPPPALALFPPGPLETVRLVPGEVRVAPGGERRVRAIAEDAAGRALAAATFVWRLEDPAGVFDVRGEGPRPAVAATPRARPGTGGELFVEARCEERVATARATLAVAEDEDAEGRTFGIPEPHLVSDADRPWRSRMEGDRWEVNDAHEDYRALRGEPRARLRYLLACLAKEIVLRTSGRPDADDVLDSLVEILAHAERNLRGS